MVGLLDRNDMERGPVAPRRQLVAGLLLIVSRTEPSRFTYLKHVFGNESVDVIMDRRIDERRQRLERGSPERRRHENRRQRDVTKDLQAYGWALVRR